MRLISSGALVRNKITKQKTRDLNIRWFYFCNLVSQNRNNVNFILGHSHISSKIELDTSFFILKYLRLQAIVFDSADFNVELGKF